MQNRIYRKDVALPQAGQGDSIVSWIERVEPVVRKLARGESVGYETPVYPDLDRIVRVNRMVEHRIAERNGGKGGAN